MKNANLLTYRLVEVSIRSQIKFSNNKLNSIYAAHLEISEMQTVETTKLPRQCLETIAGLLDTRPEFGASSWEETVAVNTVFLALRKAWTTIKDMRDAMYAIGEGANFENDGVFVRLLTILDALWDFNFSQQDARLTLFNLKENLEEWTSSR